MKSSIVDGALAFGTAFHKLLLEPDSFGESYDVLPDSINLRTKAGQAEAQELMASRPGVLWLREKDNAKLLAMADGALAHPELFRLLGEPGHAEVSFYGHGGPRGDAPIKLRADWVIGLDDPRAGSSDDPGLVIVDIKTAQDESPEAFRESVGRFNYHAQEAFYREHIEAITGRKVADFLFAVVGKRWPYHAGVYRLSPGLVQEGRLRIADAWRIYERCVKENHWPGYGWDGILTL